MFAVLGAFGHAVHADVLSGLDSGPAVPFMAMGVLGTVLGLVLLGIAVWRAGLGPRWLGPVLVVFVVVEFAGAGLSVWAGYASAVLFLVGFLTLAATVARSASAVWTTASEATSREPLTV